MKGKSILGFGLSLIALSVASAVSAGTISPQVSEIMRSSTANEKISVIIKLRARADIQSIQETNLQKRRSKLISALKSHASESQKPLLQWLSAQNDVAGWKSLWMINSVAAQIPAGKLTALAARSEVDEITYDAEINGPVTLDGAPAPAEWNIQKVRADTLWSSGYTGQGTVVASMDTGVDIDHPDISSSWRGGSNSWFDPNGEHLLRPYDSNGHGTQTMGVMVGGDSSGSSIGIAPGAKWISVKIFNDANVASLSGIHQGFQWIMDPDGDSATDDAPDVVNNSWSLTNTTDTCNSEFQADIDMLRLADISVLFSAGNTGPNSSTSVSPANNSGSLASGAIDENSTVAYFSGRGPSACGGGLYPQISAPGINVRTADLSYGGLALFPYKFSSGTSYAVPHISGAIALLKSANNYASTTDIEQAIHQSAVDAGSSGDDMDYGWGILDIAAANAILQSNAPADVDGDGVTADKDCNDNNATIYPGATEVKHDGIDQDCNGYDLTIDIISAEYNSKRDTLTVEASSALGKDAALLLEGVGAMKWNARSRTWSTSIKRAGGNPGSVIVTGIEGSETSSTTVK